jgi:predicted SprT family Zn-dependent metalloprotease
MEQKNNCEKYVDLQTFHQRVEQEKVKYNQRLHEIGSHYYKSGHGF